LLLKYIVIDDQTPVDDMVNYLYSDVGFKLPKPKVILSVTGGTKQFSIDENTKTAIKLGLMKAAKTTNACIISGGTNTGVMRLVGDAVAEDLNEQDLTVLGIASWGCIAFNNDMIV
jgi:transient receptor potential cation channel subfamily M protein 2